VNKPLSATTIIQLRDLTKAYRAGDVKVNALRGVSLDIHRGEFVAIMGASGSGKSTLMNLLGCLDQPTGGTYMLDGVSVAGLNGRQLARLRNRKLGFVFQGFNLLPRTSALDNVELPLIYAHPMASRAERRQRALQALETVGLGNRREHHPSQMSGGQQQRVAIARALITRPDVLFADEPTGNLDTQTSLDIMRLFRKLNERGITVVMVTHEASMAAYCKRILVMSDGRVVSDASNSNGSQLGIGAFEQTSRATNLA
jgi:putative ABC transport system ATP-binding protein